MACVYCAVRTVSLNVIPVKSTPPNTQHASLHLLLADITSLTAVGVRKRHSAVSIVTTPQTRQSGVRFTANLLWSPQNLLFYPWG